MLRLKLWVRSEQQGKTSPPTPLLQGEGSSFPPTLAGKGVRGLGFLTRIFKLDAPLPSFSKNDIFIQIINVSPKVNAC